MTTPEQAKTAADVLLASRRLELEEKRARARQRRKRGMIITPPVIASITTMLVPEFGGNPVLAMWLGSLAGVLAGLAIGIGRTRIEHP